MFSVCRFVPLALCFVGIVYQSCSIIERYLSYPIKIKTTFVKPAYVELPAASICLDYIPNAARVRKLYPDIYAAKQAKHSQLTWQVWTKYLTLEQFILTTIYRSEAIKRCRLYVSNMTKIDCTMWAGQRNDQISWFWKCFTLFNAAQQEYYLASDEVLYRTEDVLGVPWFEYDLNTDNYSLTMASTEIGVSIHSNDDPLILDEGSKTFRAFDFSQYKHVSLAYTRQVISRLEAPYPTRCVNYQDGGKPGRRDKLVNRCALKKFSDTTKLFPCDILVKNMTVFGQMKFASHVKGHETAIQERYECNRLYPYPDCDTLNYLLEVKGIANLYKGHQDGGSFRVTVFGPSENTVMISEEAAFLVFDLYSYLGNLISLWLGFSVSGIAWAMVGLLLKWLPRRATKMAGRSDRMKHTESRHYRCMSLPSNAASYDYKIVSEIVSLVRNRPVRS
ncbi:hypothetical protein HDE_12184 [Halotydeus destructor]|nr:hypothetical protein HDE_12184 [Halotydeus destructor]